MTSFIEVQNVEMVFASRKGRFHALRDIDLEVGLG
jgi:nitrate/nitrite transport system ATP-binding protein